jgi:ATP-dependent RNA helicase RhlE
MDDEIKLLRAIERLIKKTIPVKRIEGFSKPVKVSEKDEAAGVEAHRRRRRGGNKGAFRGGKPHETKGNSDGKRRRRAPKR